MNQYSRSIGPSSTPSSSQHYPSTFSSPFPSHKTMTPSSPSIPFSPIRKNLSQESFNDNDDYDKSTNAKSGEEALTYLGERAYFLEAFLKCLAKLTNPLKYEHFIRRESIINFGIKESRKLLEHSINSVMKGHNEPSMIGSIFSAISAIGINYNYSTSFYIYYHYYKVLCL